MSPLIIFMAFVVLVYTWYVLDDCHTRAKQREAMSRPWMNEIHSKQLFYVTTKLLGKKFTHMKPDTKRRHRGKVA